jgi:hypothetical protein
MTDKLLPCPFCWSTASLETGLTANVGGEEIQYVTCVSCSAQADPHDWQTRPDAPAPQDQTNVDALQAQVAFTLSDASRLLRKQDVQGACPHPDDCFYESDRVRCGPCAVKASASKGIEIDDTHSHLPEVCRLRREVKAAQARIAELEATTPPQTNMEGLSDQQVEAVLHLIENRLCIVWAKIGAREEFANQLRVLEPAPEEERETCEACGDAFEDGDMVYWLADDTGHIHADCCGPERESYVGEDGEPLKDGDPIPQPFAWRA